MKLALVMVILTFAVAAPPTKEPFYYYKCSENCRKEFDERNYRFICYKTNNDRESVRTRCDFDCDKKNKESFGKTVEEVECDWYEGCYNNCTEEEKQYKSLADENWCSREGDKLVKGHSFCFVKCQSRHNWRFEKEPEVVPC